ncbi:MAG: hypothetical protein FWG34_03380 [Oscillospiraceae bacterium]|nr:hypothetical protein [Oscillospiraceae bacterium]
MKKIFFGVLFAASILLANACGTGDSGSAAKDGLGQAEEESAAYFEPSDQTEPKTEKTKPGDESKAAEKSAKPTLIGSTFLAKDRYCIAGKAAEHAVITVEGALNQVETKVIGGMFVLEVFLEKQKTEDVELLVYAKNAGKDISDPLVINVSKDEPRDSKPVYIGKKNHLQYEPTLDDYLGINLFSEDQLDDMRKGAEKLQKKLADAGLKTELIIFIAPNPATIYPEHMPDFLADQRESDDSRSKQIVRAFEDSPIKVIFPYQRLKKEKRDYMLYFWADTHWNDLGAYYGYCELFEYIGEKFPDAKPIPESEIDISETTMSGGDIVSNMLFFDSYAYTSTTTMVRVKNPKAVQMSLVGDPGMGAEVWTKDDGKNRPTVMMYRDSFSVAMMHPISETAGKFIINPMWDFRIDMDLLKKENPDYLIIEKVEREAQGFPAVLR